MEFPKEHLVELLWEGLNVPTDFDGVEYTVVANDLIDTTRWALVHRMVFFVGDKFYAVEYQRGATELQDRSPFDYEPDMVECKEVKPKEKTVIEYVPV